jgi:hypothetical protein
VDAKNGGETFSMGWKPQRFLARALGTLLRAYDDLPTGHWFAYAFCSERNVEGMDTSYCEASGIRIYFRQRSAVYSSVLTSKEMQRAMEKVGFKAAVMHS